MGSLLHSACLCGAVCSCFSNTLHASILVLFQMPDSVKAATPRMINETSTGGPALLYDRREARAWDG